jgi:30S ribosomal protein S31
VHGPFVIAIRSHLMGKGDKRTFRGKIYSGSYGRTRPHKSKKPPAGKTSAPPAKPPTGR